MNLELVTTTFEDNKKKVVKQYFNFQKDQGVENEAINIYHNVKYQTMEGFGGALTDSSGYVYSCMTREQKDKVISTYFGSENMNYQFARLPIDSCDFSLEHYEAMNTEDDTNLESFSLLRGGKYIFPLLDDIQSKNNKKIELMVSPWSPPAFMKTNGERNHGGKLKSECREQWAEYLCHYIKEIQKKGYSVKRMSIQNEPNATQTWDSCTYTAKEEKEFLRDFLYQALVRNGLSHIEIFIWDHNKERAFERACEIIDNETDKMVAGIAFHWYSGDHFETLSMIREKFPNKKLILSEACIEYGKFNKEDYIANAQKYGHDMIGNLNHGMNAFYDWNIILDEVGGPNHVKNFCDAPFLFDMKNNILLEQNTLSYIWHFSHFILPNAVRIGCSKYTEQLEVTSFENPDSTIVLIILNRTKNWIPVSLRINGLYTFLYIQPESISSGIIS